MKERPILFSGPMVNAILEGRKTQTRRVIKNPPGRGDWIPAEMCATTSEGWQTSGHSGVWWCDGNGDDQDVVRCPFGKPGDRLWVRETWGFVNWDGWANTASTLRWRSNGRLCKLVGPEFVSGLPPSQRPRDGWRPSIHMPRWASRINLEITDIRVERLQDISEGDAIAEGIERPNSEQVQGVSLVKNSLSIDRFARIWDSINKDKHPWESNPWVWVVAFDDGCEEVLSWLDL